MDGRFRDDVVQLAAEFEGLRADDSERLDRYRDYREENESARSSDLVRNVQGQDYGLGGNTGDQIPRHSIPLPFGMALTVKHSYRSAGRLADAIVDRREETEFERYRSDTMEKMWWGIVRNSGDKTLFSDSAWDRSQLGASVMEVYWNPAANMPIIRTVDPAGVLVVRGLDDPHDFKRVFRFWHVPLATARSEYGEEFIGGMAVNTDRMESTHKVGGVEMATLVEACEKKRSVRFSLGGESGAAGAVPLRVREHGLGFVPTVIIPNVGPYRDVWGWADYEFVRALVHYLPKLLSREADVLRMVANGAYKQKGSSQPPEATKKVLHEGGVLPLKRDEDVEPIDPPQMPSFAENHAERVLEYLQMLGFSPDAAWGGSDTRSGSDRALQLQPQLELTAMKQMNEAMGLARLGAMCFRMIEAKQKEPATYRGSRLQGAGRIAFTPFQIGPNVKPLRGETISADPGSDVELPRSPKELFQKDYSIRFEWQNRIDPDDPAFVLSELNKFQQGVQSLRTTLERLGFKSPEDEMKLIEEEADKYPWLRQGMIALIRAQLSAQNGGGAAGASQGLGGGAPADPLVGLLSGLTMTQTGDGAALDQDAGAAALGGDVPGQLYGGA